LKGLIRTRPREERREDLGELSPGDFAVFDVDGLEHRLVEATAHGGSRLPIRRVTVAGELDRGPQDILRAPKIGLRDAERSS